MNAPPAQKEPERRCDQNQHKDARLRKLNIRGYDLFLFNAHDVNWPFKVFKDSGDARKKSRTDVPNKAAPVTTCKEVKCGSLIVHTVKMPRIN